MTEQRMTGRGMTARGMKRMHRATLTAVLCALAMAGEALVPAQAQTPLTPVAPDPAISQWQSQVASLEQELRRLTSDNEKLDFELRKANAEIVRLTKERDDAIAQGGGGGLPAGQGAALAPAPAPAPPRAGAPMRAANPAPTGPALTSLDPPPPAPGAANAGAPADAPEAFRKARELVFASRFAEARPALSSFLQTYPAAAEAPEARYWLGRTLLAQNAPVEAAKQFMDVVKRNPGAARAPDSMLLLGVSLKRMGEKDQACATFRELSTRFPKAAPNVKESALRELRAAGCSG